MAMEMMSIGDAANFEQVTEMGKQKNAGYTIAWILAAIFILAILFWVFNRGYSDNKDLNCRAADHNCAQATKIGILEGEMKSVGTVLSQLVPNVNELGRLATGTNVGLNEWVKCAEDKFTNLNTGIYRLDNAVYMPRCGEHRCGEGRCGEGRCGGGNRRFDQRSTYIPQSTEVIVSETRQN